MAVLDLRDVESVAAKGMSVRAATALALVAELRAARELRAACGSFDPQRVAAALAAYDKVVSDGA